MTKFRQFSADGLTHHACAEDSDFHCGLGIADCGLGELNPQSEICNPQSASPLQFVLADANRVALFH
ncbi:MAG: hypothetical protein AAB658_14900, partial [Chloroflexota bacterium]